jgi:bifunctional DNase/RNase
MDILGLSTSPSSGGAYALILNEVNGSRRLPIIIGTFEAQAIALELEHIKPPRPMTHDLLKNVIQTFGAEVQQIYINDLSEGTFFAQIIYQKNGEEIKQDARPSDAIALAVRFNAPIYVSGDILDEAGIVSEVEEEESPAVASAKSESQSREMSKIEQLESELQTAIETENYEKAARLRDEIKKLKG